MNDSSEKPTEPQRPDPRPTVPSDPPVSPGELAADQEAERSTATVPYWRTSQAWWLGSILTIMLVLIWQVIDLRHRISGAQEELARRLAESGAQQVELRLQVRQTIELGQALQQKVNVIEARVADFQGQQQSLEGLYQELARGRDEWLLSEVDQLVGLATQQLQITGNVAAAFQALTNAETRLARSQRPQFIGLRKAIGNDLQRLKSLRAVDLSGISLRLENVALSVDQMGLAYEARPAATPLKPGGSAKLAVESKTAESSGSETFWRRWLNETWAEIRSLINVERMDRPDPVVLAPNQIFFLRENLKLRLLSARVELLTRDQSAFRSEVKQSLQWIEKHFDARDRRVQSAVESLKPLLSSDLAIDAPSLAESLAAVRAVKLPSERLVR